MKTFASFFLAASLTFTPILFHQDAKQDPENPSKSFLVKKGGMLEVNVDPGNVRIEPWSKEEVFIQAENIDDRYPDRLKMTQSGTTVRVEYRDRRRNVRDLRFVINVPVEFNVKIETSGGNVEQKELLKGSFNVETKGGNITMTDITGQVDIHSGGGNIRGETIDGNMNIKTGGGNVTVKSAKGETEVESGGGNLKLVEVGKGLKLDTGGGNVNVGDVGGEATIKTGGGNLKLGRIAQKLVLTTGGGNVEVLGASGVNTVKTGGGNVDMEGISGSIGLKTGGGNVKVELTPTGKGPSTIYSGGGDIQFLIPENAKVTIEATLKIKYSGGGRSKKYKVDSDFKADKFERDSEDGSTFAVYKLNGGGEKIELETTNGDITIRKLKK